MVKRSNGIAIQEHSSSSPLSVFCTAAPADETLLLQWETYLLPLQQARLISCWSTRHLAAGADVEQERSLYLDHADLILLLLSADFFASNECLAVMHHALERQRAGSVRVIPLLLRQVEWHETELAALTCLPANGLPITQWTTQDEAWHACVLGLQPFLRQRFSTTSSTFPSVRAQRRATSDRERMLGRLRKTYQGLLDDSLYGIAWMDLGLASKPDAVRNASHLLLRLPERDEQVLAPGTSILHAYEQAQEELLILGAPGAGKSTLLLDLAVQLVERARSDETHPLPVILPLSSWALQHLPLAEWLIEQLAHTYDIPRTLSRRWVEQEDILPLLDGLDEMEEAARSACITAINIYHREHLTPLVVCSRQNEYAQAAARERLALQSAVVVQPLTPEHVEMALRLAGPAFAGLRTALEHQPALQELATTPLMLSVLLLTYQGSSLEAIVQANTDLEQRVWTDYVARMVQQKGDETYYPLEQTRRWLTWLAQQMRVHQQTVFYAEYLQSDWLARNQQRTVAWLTIRVPALVLGALAGILVYLFVSGFYDLASLVQMGLFGGFVGGCLSRKTDTRTATVGSHLSASKQVSLLGCMLFGVLIAASFDLHYSLYSLGISMLDGSILGLGSGLSAWIFQILLLRLPRQLVSVSSTRPSRRWRVSAWFNTIAPQNVWLAALVLGAGTGLSYILNKVLRFGLLGLQSGGLNYGLRGGLSDGLVYGLILGPINGLSLGLMVVMVNIILNVSLGTLRFAERIHWTWHSLLRPGHLRTSVIVTCIVSLLLGVSGGLNYESIYSLINGLSGGANDGLINGLSSLLSSLLDSGLSYGLSHGLSFGLSYWLLMGVYQGMVQKHIEDQDRHQFNQGILRSLRNGMFVSLVSASIIAGMKIVSAVLSSMLSSWLILYMSYGLKYGLSEDLSYGLSDGLSNVWILVISGFLVMWAMSGGLTVLRHYVIRGFLARSQHFPWRAQAFLDDATARILLQRVGGGYRFMHRRLLDYFADLDDTATPASASEHEV